MDHLTIYALTGILVPLACGCVLPIMAIWFGVRQKMNETNQRTQIVLAAIEKNPEMDIEELLRKISPKKKLLKEKLLSRLLTGCITTFLGLALLVYCTWLGYVGGSGDKNIYACAIAGTILFAIGIAFLVNYFLGKKMLAKEIEAEEKIMMKQAEGK